MTPNNYQRVTVVRSCGSEISYDDVVDVTVTAYDEGSMVEIRLLHGPGGVTRIAVPKSDLEAIRFGEEQGGCCGV